MVDVLLLMMMRVLLKVLMLMLMLMLLLLELLVLKCLGTITCRGRVLITLDRQCLRTCWLWRNNTVGGKFFGVIAEMVPHLNQCFRLQSLRNLVPVLSVKG